jgi:hemerythrin-like metal-binding protein
MESHIWKIVWNDDMSVGIPEIDEDHKRFASLINDFNRSILDRMDIVEIKRRLQRVLDDAVQHFAHEERLFKEWQYPDADEHAARHAEAVAAYQAIMEKFVTYDLESEWIDAGQQVKDLLITHLLEEDMKYAAFYRKFRADSRTEKV